MHEEWMTALLDARPDLTREQLVDMQPCLHMLAEFLIITALTAIGLSAELRRRATWPMLPGRDVWVAVAASSLLVQRVVVQL